MFAQIKVSVHDFNCVFYLFYVMETNICCSVVVKRYEIYNTKLRMYTVCKKKNNENQS